MELVFKGRVTTNAVVHALDGLDTDMSWDETSERWRPVVQTGALPDGGLHVNFLDVTGFRFVAMAPLIMWLSAWRDAGFNLRVTLPERGDARTELASMRFLECLDEPDEGAKPGLLQVLGDRASVARFNLVFPYRWVSPEDDVRSFLKFVLRDRTSSAGPVLSWGSALEFADYIVEELLENVSDHSGTSRALVGIIVPERHRKVSSFDFFPSEQTRFITRATSEDISIDLVIADLGCGIERTLGQSRAYSDQQQDLLNYAFNRWSTTSTELPDHGTRGLYRVARLAARLGGFATLCSGSAHVTEAGLLNAALAERPIVSPFGFPGTLLRVNLPLDPIRRSARTPLTSLPDTEMAIVRRLRATLSTERELRKVARVFQDFPGLKIVDCSALEFSYESVQDFLRVAIGLLHPGPAALIGIDLPGTALGSACEAVNADMQRKLGPFYFQDVDPVSVLGRTYDEVFWVGVPPDLQDEMDAGLPDRRPEFAIGPHLVHEGPDGSILRNSAGSLGASLKSYLTEHALSCVRPAPDGAFLTTSLSKVKGWLSLEKMIPRDRPEQVLAVYSIVSEIQAADPAVLAAMPFVVAEAAIDSQFSDLLGAALIGGLQHQAANSFLVHPEDIDAGRILGLPEGAPVLVLVQAVSEGLAARQLIAFCKRQELRVVGVAAVADTRESQPAITMWEEEIPVFAAVRLSLSKKDAVKVTPLDARGEVEITRAVPRLPMSTKDAVDLLSDGNAIRLGHYISERDRHFTFFIDSTTLMASRSWGVFGRAIEQIVAEIRSSSSSIGPVLACHETRVDAPAKRVAKYIAGLLGQRQPSAEATLTAARASRSSPLRPIILVVWGTLTGQNLISSIQRMARLGTRRLEVIVVFSEVSHDLEMHFRNIREVQTRAGHTMQVRIQFVTRVPIQTFSYATCPMCSQMAGSAREDHSIVEVERERRRLEPVSWRGRASENSDTFGDVYGGGSRPMVRDAFWHRQRLLEASGSTLEAAAVDAEWKTHAGDRDWVLGIATLLIYEPTWLRRRPLRNGDIREWLANELVNFVAPEQAVLAPDFAEIARVLIALRLVSKTALVKSTALLIEAIGTDARCLSLLLHLLRSISARKHLSNWQMRSLMYETAAEGLRLVRAGNLEPELTDHWRAYVSETKNQFEHRVRANSIADAFDVLRDAAGTFTKHFKVKDDFQGASVEASVRDPEEATAHWAVVERWTARLAGPLVLVRDRLAMSPTLAGSDAFRDVFPENGTAGIVSEAAHIVERSASTQTSVGAEQSAILDRARQHLIELFEVHEGSSTFVNALDYCFVYGRDVRSGARRTLGEWVEFEERDVLSRATRIHLPQTIVDMLFKAVASNVRKHSSSPKVVLSIDLSQSALQIRLVCHNSFSSESGDVELTGGLGEVKSELPRGASIEGFANAAAKTFTILLSIKDVVT